MIADLITAVTVLLALAITGGTIIACLLAAHAHDERLADAAREEQRQVREAQREIRGVHR
jgi:hypothetical protein